MKKTTKPKVRIYTTRLPDEVADLLDDFVKSRDEKCSYSQAIADLVKWALTT